MTILYLKQNIQVLNIPRLQNKASLVFFFLQEIQERLVRQII